MTRLSCCIPVALILALGTTHGDAYARGFGGFHGGGFGGGGFHGGGFGGGGFHGGGFGGGGFHGGDSGGFRGGDLSGDRSAGYRGGSFDNGGYRGGDFGRSEAGNYAGIGNREAGGRGAGAYGAGRWGGSLNRGELNGFLGLPTDSGLHAAGGALANRGFGDGQGIAGAYGTHPFSQTWAHAQGQGVQNWASDHPAFTSAWNSAHPWAWNPAGVDAAAWATSAWAGAAWPAMGNWLGWDNPASYAYDYGDNITYQGDDVYYGSQPAGTAQQYYQEASNLAASAPATPPSNSQWLPLGVFGLVEGDSKKPTLTFQLALNKDGTIRGNSVNQYSDVLPLQGAVNKKTQRVCWTVGGDKTTVYDTGLYNLTKGEAPILVHTGPKSTQQELLVRLKEPHQSGSGNGALSSAH